MSNKQTKNRKPLTLYINFTEMVGNLFSVIRLELPHFELEFLYYESYKLTIYISIYSGCTEEDYITMGHIADQTEKNHILQEQGTSIFITSFYSSISSFVHLSIYLIYLFI